MKDEMGIVGASPRLMFGEIEVLPQLLCCACRDYCAFSLYSCSLTEICC